MNCILGTPKIFLVSYQEKCVGIVGQLKHENILYQKVLCNALSTSCWNIHCKDMPKVRRKKQIINVSILCHLNSPPLLVLKRTTIRASHFLLNNMVHHLMSTVHYFYQVVQNSNITCFSVNNTSNTMQNGNTSLIS